MAGHDVPGVALVKLTITLRLVLWMATTATMIYSVGVWYDYQLTRGHILQKSRLEAGRIVNSAMADLTANLEGVESSTELFARVLSEELLPPTALQDMLRKTVSPRRDLYGAAIAIAPGHLQPGAFAPYYFHPGAPAHYDPDGKVSYVDLANPDYDLEKQSWYRLPQQTRKALWTDPYFDDGGGNVLMATYSVPLIHDGQPFGVVTADITLDRLRHYLDRIRLGADGFALLATRDGDIVSHPDAALSLKSLAAVYPAMEQPAWKAALAQVGQADKQVMDLPCPHMNDECVVGFSTLSDTGWILIVLYPKQEMLGELNDHSFKVILIAIAGALALLIVVSLISRRLTLPLVALVSASERLGSGDLEAPLPEAKGEDEVAQLITTFAGMRERLKEFISKLEQETASRNRLQGELNAAHQIQMEMLPENGSGHLQNEQVEVWARLIPAKSVGGDLYTWLDSENGKLWLVVGDVSDKGVPAALFMARTLTLFQQLASSGLPVSELMARLNDALSERNDACMFVTLFCGLLDLDTGMLEFASGGHTAPILRRNDQVLEVEQVHGSAMGLCEGEEFPLNRLQLSADDVLCIYTDGIDEAFNPAHEQFGHERLKKVLALKQDHIANSGEAILSAVIEFADEAPQSDDITLMLLRWSGASTHSSASAHPLLLASDAVCQVQAFSFPPKLAALDELFVALAGWLTASGCMNADLLHDLKLVVEEVFVNIVHYGGLAADDNVMVLFAKYENSVLLEFIDRGVAWNPLDDAPEPELGLETEEAAIGGLGVFLVHELTDKQAYWRDDGANRFCVLKYLD